MRFLFISLAVVAAMFMASPVAAKCSDQTGDKGVVLLIGMSAYDDLSWPILQNAVNDIDHVCTAFAKAGFTVIDVRDAPIAELNEAAADFALEAEKADTAIVYYAGHGFEYSGRNYMVPVDAPRYASKSELDSLFLPLEKLLKAASSAKKFSLFFMDACRVAEPVVALKDVDQRGVEGSVSPLGLLEMEQGAVFYSTAKGRPALDAAPSGSRVSPFAHAIAKRLAIPGLELSDYFKVVSRDVYARTRSMDLGPQQPFHYGSWFEDFYLNKPVTVSVDDLKDEIAAEEKKQSEEKAKKKAREEEQARRREAAEPPEPKVVHDMPPPLPMPAPAPPPSTTVFAYQFIAPTIAQTLEYLNNDRLAVEDEPIIVAEILEDHGVADITLAAATGNPVAQYLLGYMYHLGVGVEKDLTTARQWLEKSAKQFHPAGLTELAYFLQENEPGEKQRAFDLYDYAAAMDFAKAQSHLGYALWHGTLGKTDKQRALDLFGFAAEKGHPYATFALGIYGKKVQEAEIGLRKLAEKGNVEGNNWICELRYQMKNVAAAAEDCAIAARGGYAGARAIVAQLYDRGQGVEQSSNEALFWAKLANKQKELATRPDLFGAVKNILSRK